MQTIQVRNPFALKDLAHEQGIIHDLFEMCKATGAIYIYIREKKDEALFDSTQAQQGVVQTEGLT